MMKRRNEKKSLDSENKLELAKTIAETSESLKKTYTNIENGFVRGFKKLSTWVDYIIFNQRFARLVAVLLALFLYLVINGENTGVFTTKMQQSISLEGISVISNVSESVYEVEGLPETVDVIVRGESGDVQFASQQKASLQVLADLESFGEGTYEVTFQPVNFSDDVEVTIEPSKAVVSVKKKLANTFTIGHDYINTDKMDKSYSLSTPVFSQTEVIVKASEETLSQVAFVKALINLDGVKADFVQECTLVAYDQSGDRIDVDILPKTVGATVEVTQPSKEVPIVIKSTGVMSDEYAIESYELDNETMTIYATEEVLDTIEEVVIEVPVNKITTDTVITMPIMLPPGVTSGSISKVSIILKVGKSEEVTLENVKVTPINVNSNFVVSFVEENSIDVLVNASKNIIDFISATDLDIVIDLAEYDKAGVYSIPLSMVPKVQFVHFALLNNTIQIKLEEK